MVEKYMDLSNERLRYVLFISTGILVGLLLLINIVRYANTIPDYETTVYPTIAQGGAGRGGDLFPTLKPSEVNQELEEILNKRADLSTIQKEAVASLSAELVLHPKRDQEFEITYSPMLNLFFVRKRGNADDAIILEYLKDPVMQRLYQENSAYRLFVFSRGSAEYSKYVFERQYKDIRSKLPEENRPQ